MNLVQFSHGVIVEAENFKNRIVAALPSFTPAPEKAEEGEGQDTTKIDGPQDDLGSDASKPADTSLAAPAGTETESVDEQPGSPAPDADQTAEVAATVKSKKA
jgi:hypothetical protein